MSANEVAVSKVTSPDSQQSDPNREFLRHTLATLAYRGAKAFRNAPVGFGDFQPGQGARTPAQILAHIGDLLDWALSMANGEHKWNSSSPLPWDEEVNRFFAALKKFDDFLSSAEPLQAPYEKLFQGPLADSFTHIGQISILRRMAGEPVRGENYFIADIVAGRVGTEQTAPKFEF
jgi:hypothetical protein